MSRTFKDRPYRLSEAEASSAGYLSVLYSPLRACWNGGDGFAVVGDVDGYEYSRHNHRTHVPIRGYRDMRCIEDGWWATDYGAPRSVVSQRLRAACRLANDGSLDEDWDDPVVYQRRRRWYVIV